MKQTKHLNSHVPQNMTEAHVIRTKEKKTKKEEEEEEERKKLELHLEHARNQLEGTDREYNAWPRL